MKLVLSVPGGGTVLQLLVSAGTGLFFPSCDLFLNYIQYLLADVLLVCNVHIQVGRGGTFHTKIKSKYPETKCHYRY